MTVCNLNGISFSNLKNAAENFKNVKTFYNTLISSDKYHNVSQDGEAKFVMPMKPRTLFWALSHEAKHIGHKLEDMILSCRFA